jgi:uncharacterized protein (DUF433 family)
VERQQAMVAPASRIAVDPGVHFGQPVVSGTRIPVQAVLELVAEGIPFADIVRDYYPDLEMGDVKACVQYAVNLVDYDKHRIRRLK